MKTRVKGTISIEFGLEIDESYGVADAAKWAEEQAENLARMAEEQLRKLATSGGYADGTVKRVEVSR